MVEFEEIKSDLLDALSSSHPPASKVLLLSKSARQGILLILIRIFLILYSRIAL